MGTVRREPRDGDGFPACCFAGVYIPYALAEMARHRVVCLVHGDCAGVVVYGYVDGPPGRQFYAGAGPAASGEIVHYELTWHISSAPSLFFRAILRRCRRSVSAWFRLPVVTIVSARRVNAEKPTGFVRRVS